MRKRVKRCRTKRKRVATRGKDVGERGLETGLGLRPVGLYRGSSHSSQAGPENLDVRSVTGGMALRHCGACKGNDLVTFQVYKVLYTLGEVRYSNSWRKDIRHERFCVGDCAISSLAYLLT